MKITYMLLLGLAVSLTLMAQQNIGTVDLTVFGNKNLKLELDDRNLGLANSTVIGTKTTLSIKNLAMGEHILQVLRTDQNANMQERITSLFNLREGYDMHINVNQDGSLELIETKAAGTATNMAPMNTVNFNNLLNNVRIQKSTTGRRNVIANALTNTRNYFTTSQVSQLLQLVNSESFRLQLAKLSYRTITDPVKFYQVYALLNSEASRIELKEYVDNYKAGGGTRIAMSDANFNSLYQNIQQQWPVSSQMNSLTAAFNNTDNYFSTYQARQLIQLVSAEANRLQLAKLSYRSITDPDNFNQLYNLLNSQASRDELAAYVNNYNAGSSTGVAMSDANFNSLYQAIQQQWPVSSQMNSLTAAFNNTNNYFSTYQARQLIQLVSAEANRLQLAKLSYRSITDPVNFNQLYNLLNSQASRDELAAYVNNYNAGSSAGIAMSDANFNTLYQAIQQQWPVSSQMNSLTAAFANTNNYFSTYQARQLIQLVSAESNRLQLAKLSYRSITDPSNFSQLYNLLSSQASRDELAAYVNNYTGGSNPKVPMSDADFNSLYQTIQSQFFPNEKMNSLTNVFNKPGMYFTSAQAKQLVALVSFESNRLQLAKLSYRTITDRSNFQQLYELLSSQSSRNELQAYVNAYKD